jgi:predicted Zn-dependent peptidase
MWDPYAEFQSATLPNGLTVYVAHWPGRPWEAMGFLIHSGAEHDPIGLEGLAHFVEHLVSENANVSKKDLIAFFQNCGGMVSLGITDYPYMLYRFFVPIDKAIITRAFSIFGYMLLSAKLEKSIERERQVIIGEFHQHYPVEFKFDLDMRQHKALYAGYWLERFVRPLGNPESVGRITQSDLQSYYDTHYTPANMSIVGVGGMRLQGLVELLSESPFAMTKKGVRTPLPTPVTDVAPPSENRYVFEASKHIRTPVEVGSYRSVAKIPGNINGQVIRIMKEMLYEILNEEVRERRAWAYGINAYRYNFRYFYEFSISCSALALEAIDGIEEVVERCITSVGDREDLFERAKRRALASNFMIDSAGKGVCDGALDDLAKYHRIISLTEIGDDLERVTMSDVRNLLQWLRPERRWTLIIRP